LVTEEGAKLFIRPVRPEDAPMFQEFFHVLSPTTVYYRFFRFVKELTREMLARYTQIDYDREIALVALEDEAPGERMLGVARIIGDPDGKTGEVAVVVGDPWHGKGIGSALLSKCLSIAKERGFRTISGLVRKENVSMLALGEKLGFKQKYADLGELELVIELE
ncbi:MAG: N-acetyltransferase family protein, partial [Desulfobacteraceae bacterium]